ncbi:hypothetical protein [Hymenobacter elongatus]|uniref:Uncharacterized protein n=1 Tax=Hymenobacter elongatus TaxID=877208 RepID=A0A4Z0PNQ7_9BACT|nr:hypothetical protein [Hymenobacter elongatus]TGE18565.1 hypothetical protein E5J99_04480 [Hymenobacter elongatus]
METNIYSIIESAVNLPSDFHLKNISAFTLLQESNYFESYNKIHEESIISKLNSNPSLVDQWLQWSEDQRTSSGWYFKKLAFGRRFVGYYPKVEEFFEIKSFDKFKVCAAYIKLQAERIRTLF